MARGSWYKMIAQVERDDNGTLCMEKNFSNLKGRGEYPKRERVFKTVLERKDLRWVRAGVLTTGILSVGEVARETSRKYRNLDYKRRVTPGLLSENEKAPYLGMVRVTASFIYGYVWWSRLKRHYFCCGQPYEMLSKRGMGMHISLASKKDMRARRTLNFDFSLKGSIWKARSPYSSYSRLGMKIKKSNVSKKTEIFRAFVYMSGICNKNI